MKRLLLLLTISLSSSFAIANNDLMIHDAYARATPPNSPTSAVFLTLMNHSDNNRSIVSASSPASGKVELHTHVKEGDVMKMRQVANIDVPANTTVELKPGGLHIMLFDLKQAFNEGGNIEVTVNYADGSSQTFAAPIKKVMAGMMKMKH